MATGGDVGVTVCPFCQAPVDGQDELQLHYLTSCIHYTGGTEELAHSKPPLSNGQTLPSRSEATALPPAHSATVASSRPRATGSSVTPSATATQAMAKKTPESCSVQFMWQPLTEITYPKVTLLASFDPGTVELSLDPEGSHYASSHVTIPAGKYEGQLVVGDSFVHPVKEFTVEKAQHTIVLQFEVTGTGHEHGRYGGGYMQANPSYRGYGGEQSGHQGYTTGGYGGYSARRDVDINEPYAYYPGSGGGGSRVGEGGRYGTTAAGGTARRRAAGGSYRTSGDGLQSTSEFEYHHHYTETGQSPGQPSALGDAYRQDRTNQSSVPGTQPGTSQPSASVRTKEPSPSSHVIDNTRHKPVVAVASSKTTRPGESTFSAPKAAELRGRESSEADSDEEEINDINAPREVLPAAIRPGPPQGERRERTIHVPDERLSDLEGQVRRLAQERDSLRQNLERARTQLQADVSRLRKQPQEQPQQRELDQLKTELVRNSKQLRELKDQNAALQEQLTEYAGAINDQSKVIRGTAKARDTELLQTQQLCVQYRRFMQKQQLEHAESINSIKKQIAQVDGRTTEKQRLHQLNTQLTGELEDYRTQTKRLLADLQQKDAEIQQLRQQLSKRGGTERDHLELELETMKQKCDAWQKEVGRLSSVQEELEQAQELAQQQQAKIQQLSADNEGLGEQLQAFVDEGSGDARKQEEMTRKASEYDTLMDRLTELQQVRAQLENELGPLREERATILQENAILKEGTDPANYVKLKEECSALSARVEELQAALEQEKELVQRHESTNRQLQQKLADATNPDQLQSISDRMERYRQERDLARQTVGETEAQLQVLQGESSEKLTAALQKAMEEAEVQVAQLQNDLAGKEGDITTLSAKVTDYQSKSRRYRDERNQFKKTCESLERQVAELRSALDDMVAQSKVQPHSDQDSVDPSTPDYTSHPPASLGHTETTSVNPPQVQKVSESEGQEERTYSPIRYATEEYPNLPHESPTSPLPKSEGKHRSSLKSKIPGSAPRSSSLSSSTASLKSDKRGSSSSAAFLAEVRSKEETVRLWLQRPAELPSVKSKPPIIVKRAGGTYERGTLMFLGHCGDRTLAGVQLELPDGNNDGTLKRDGKRYFRCEPNYGLYLPPDKIYVELGDDTASV